MSRRSHKPTTSASSAAARLRATPLRLYRVPRRFLDGDWCIYDGTNNVLITEHEELAEVLQRHGEPPLASQESHDVREYSSRLPAAKARSWLVQPRRVNQMNNSGYRVHVAWDPVARHGLVWIKSYDMSDADIRMARRNVTLEKLVEAARESAAVAQATADGNW